MPYLIIAVIGVLLDQAVKWLVRTHIALGQVIPVIPGVLGLSYVQNTGAAFSSFSNSTVILAAVSAIATVVLIIVILRRPFHSVFPMLCLSGMLIGAAGNFIDRFFIGFVTDMFKTLFINFAVFNVADAFLVLGVFGFAIYAFFLEPGEHKK